MVNLKDMIYIRLQTDIDDNMGYMRCDDSSVVDRRDVNPQISPPILLKCGKDFCTRPGDMPVERLDIPPGTNALFIGKEIGNFIPASCHTITEVPEEQRSYRISGPISNLSKSG
ncbi:MAG: hypothetical protein KJ600_01240 [Nanoarchaeota archaeon]|nr:hypothetical protein [Nanoarchaeota archaeon]MBU1103167.1 hypothetical protein [Nanoarchaeota archaeon]